VPPEATAPKSPATLTDLAARAVEAPTAESKGADADRLPSQERVDALLDQALSGARTPSAPAPEVLAETPSRDEVMAAMQVILPALRGCAMGQGGAASAGIVVRNDGRVASVEVAGAPFAGNASGRCMEGVIRRARFPRFRAPTFRVRFPFSIQ
jgi:hypothetical protein